MADRQPAHPHLVVLTLVFFWFVGHIVEEMLGRTRFTILIAIVTVVPAAIVTALPPDTFPTLPEIGLSLLLTTLFVVFAAENPHAPFVLRHPDLDPGGRVHRHRRAAASSATATGARSS